jgi:hypothetical protein
LKQEEVWEELLPELRRYVVLRKWNVGFLVTHFHQEPRTIGSWLLNVRRPTGDCLVALWYVLHEFGFSMPGINKLDETVGFAGRMFSFGAMRPEEILDVFFNLEEAINRDLYQILRGDRTPRRTIDERSGYQPLLTHRIVETLALEQEATKSATSIRQIVSPV